jgi:hypothetical protein
LENGDDEHSDSSINRGVNDFTNFDLSTSQNKRDNTLDSSMFNDGEHHQRNLSHRLVNNETDSGNNAKSLRFFKKIFF